MEVGMRIWAMGIQDGHAEPCTGERKNGFGDVVKWV